jgi:hypothetical protein
MHTNVAINSDKNRVNDTCFTYLQVRAAVITARARAWIHAAGRQHCRLTVAVAQSAGGNVGNDF